MRSDLVDIYVHLHAETEKAIKVSLLGDAKESTWVPKSQCEFEPKTGAIGVLTLPESVAIEKELV